MPDEIQLQRTKGWRMPPGSVKVDRTTRWGNPAVIGKPWAGVVVEDAAHAVRIFRHGVAACAPGFPALVDIRRDLAGQNLACWCAIGSPCHRGVLLRLANPDRQDPGQGDLFK